MSTQSEHVIAFGVDARFAPHLAVVLTSVVKNAPGGNFRFLVLHDGLPQEHKDHLISCAPNQTFEWHEITEAGYLALEGKRHISRASYYRIAIPDFAPSTAEKVVYLDADIVVTGDIRELWDVDLKGKMVGGVFDPGVDPVEFAKQYDLSPRYLGYLNSGILLLDLKQIREKKAFDTVFEIVRDKAGKLEYNDQDAINIAFWNEWTSIDPVWNVQRRMVVRNENKPCFAKDEDMPTHRRPKIIHYTEHNKPWSQDAYHPYTWKYYTYLKQTPYWKEVAKSANATLLRNLRRRLRTFLSWLPLKA
ncbi:glycosyltransferase family 8 protein [Hirschia litorea]|uniref:Glycosyltransferase family 8 protein n=1 Tax=Hirschia litorea TaxID=1199156 RepID=A0ABW2IFV1_9PROT